MSDFIDLSGYENVFVLGAGFLNKRDGVIINKNDISVVYIHYNKECLIDNCFYNIAIKMKSGVEIRIPQAPLMVNKIIDLRGDTIKAIKGEIKKLLGIVDAG